jgi:6-phosphogluconolactonase
VTNPDKHRWIAANHVPQLNTWRITFTPQLINAAAMVVFLISGKNKAPALQQVRKGPYQPETYPAQLINPENGQLIWLVDDQAGKDIK